MSDYIWPLEILSHGVISINDRVRVLEKLFFSIVVHLFLELQIVKVDSEILLLLLHLHSLVLLDLDFDRFHVLLSLLCLVVKLQLMALVCYVLANLVVCSCLLLGDLDSVNLLSPLLVGKT